MRAETLWTGGVVLAMLVVVALNRGWFRGMTAKRYATADEQLHAEFAQAHHHEARQILDAVTARADPSMREDVRRILLRHARGDIQRLRAAAGDAAAGVDRAYAILDRLGVDPTATEQDASPGERP